MKLHVLPLEIQLSDGACSFSSSEMGKKCVLVMCVSDVCVCVCVCVCSINF